MIWIVVIIPIILLIFLCVFLLKYDIGEFLDLSTPEWLGGEPEWLKQERREKEYDKEHKGR